MNQTPRLLLNNFTLYLALFLLLITVDAHQAQAQQPNVIVILADDLGYGDVGFNGCLDIPTPNIDNLATQGVIFTSGYVSHSYCAPTRAGLLTGRYQQRFGFEANPDNSVIDYLPSNQITIGNVLTNVGYKTIAVGKWHLGGNNPNQPPNRGFTDYFGFLGGGNPYFPTEMRRDLTTVVETNYITEAFTREAIAYITNNVASGNPFFLYLSYNAPHQVLAAPQTYLDKFTNIVDSTRQVYAAVVNALDDGIGEVMQSLEDTGIATNTLVFFLSDNGGPTSTTSAENTPLRGFKGNVFEGGVHVPFAACWPGRISPGSIYTNPVISLDIFATVAELAGAEIPSDRPMDSVNLLPYILGETNGIPHEQLYWRQNGGEMWAIREGSWKWEDNPTNAGPLLVQLAADGTGEFTDLSSNEAARVTAMESAYSAWDAQMLEPLFGNGKIIEINHTNTFADNLGYIIGAPANTMGYVLTTPRYPPNTSSNFLLQFSMEMISNPGGSTNGYIVLGEAADTNSLILAGVSINSGKLIITELETGGSSEVVLSPLDYPVGTNAYTINFDKAANSLKLQVGTVSVTRVLSRPYGIFSYPGYSLQDASTRFSVIMISHTPSESVTPTYEWDAGAVDDRNWSNNTNWTGGLEPMAANIAYINGGFTAVVSQVGEEAFNLYVGSTNNPSNESNSTGSVEQTGGDVIVGNALYLGKHAGGAGSYLLTGGLLQVTNTIYVGDQGRGALTITNTGSVTAQNIVIGNGGAGTSVPGSQLTLGSGSLSANSFLYIGGDTITDVGPDGTYDQFGGAATVAATVRVANNESATGRLEVAGGSFDVLLNLQIGNYVKSRGTMNVSGTSTVHVFGVTTLGKNLASWGSLSVSGGLFIAEDNIEVAEAATSTGTLVVAGGHIQGEDIVVGRQGTGRFEMNGGSVTSSTLALSFAPNGVGSLNLSGGRLVMTNAGENLSLRRWGAEINISGGTLAANGVAVGSVIGHNSAVLPAIINISGGKMIGGSDNSSSIANDFYIGSGSSRTGVVNISGGTLDLSRPNNDLIIGRGTNSLGIFTMDGGTTIVAGAVRVGALIVADSELTGNGQIYMTNGLFEIGGTLQLPITAGATAFVSQVGGIIDVGGSIAIGTTGGGGDGRYVVSGGTLTNSGTLIIGDASSGSGYFEVLGSTPLIHVDSLAINTMGELRCTFNGNSIAPIYAADSITADGILSIGNTGSYNGTYLIATSVNGTAVSGTFAATNWLNGVTGTVSYANNRILVTFASIPVLIGVPSDDVAECDLIPAPAIVTATNSCGELSAIVFSETTNAGSCASTYELVRVWSVTNTCGLGAIATQIISVVDAMIPEITCPPDTYVLCAANADPSVTGFATATDNCDPSPVVTYADVQVTGLITRTWTAMDACGNEDMCVQTITLDTNISPAPIKYVIHIFADGMHALAPRTLVEKGIGTNFHRLMVEGSYTEHARTDYDRTVTSPNYASVFTGRPVYDWPGKPGHLWGNNDTFPWERWGLTLHDPHIVGNFYGPEDTNMFGAAELYTTGPNKTNYEYVVSLLDVVHDSGLKTSMTHSKNRIRIEERSYDAVHGRLYPNVAESDLGDNKVDYGAYETPFNVLTNWMPAMVSNLYNYSFVHFSLPDNRGHSVSWSLTNTWRSDITNFIDAWNTNTMRYVKNSYMGAIQDVDAYIGDIFGMIENTPELNGKTAIIVSADHGGLLGTFDHGDPTEPDNFGINVFTWGPGIPAGGDLYALNRQYTDPGLTNRPDYNDPKRPIRDVDTGNLALSLLGLGAIPGSSINADQSFGAVDTDSDGLSDNYEKSILTNPCLWDSDGDGMGDGDELTAGTNPTNSMSILRLIDLNAVVSENVTSVKWSSESNRIYTLWGSTDLIHGFNMITGDIPATPMVNVYTNGDAGTNLMHYRISVQP